MKIPEQLSARRKQTRRSVDQIHQVTGIATSSISNVLNGKVEARSGTLQALADALDCTWVLVPKHLLPEVERLLSGKTIGPDDAPSTVDQLFAGGSHE